MQHARDLRALVLLGLLLERVSNQVIVTNDQVLHSLRFNKSNTLVRNWLISQPIVIVMETD